MFGQRKSTRFNLLLLDEGEYYCKDFVATCAWPAEVKGNWQQLPSLSGQLRVCTKSLFFEPDDVRVPIVRIPFEHVQQMEGTNGHQIIAASQRWTLMKPNAADSPYIFEKGSTSTWIFDLTYAQLGDFMPVAQHMLVASRMPPHDQEELLQSFMQQMEDEFRFDPGHLRSPATETILLELPALNTKPLVREPGRFVVTTARIYLQPLHNISGGAPVHSHPLRAITAVARRRNSLKDVGLELFYVDPSQYDDCGVGETGWGSSSVFLAFRSQQDRDKAVDTLMSQAQLGTALSGGKETAAACGSILEASSEWLERVTLAWQHGKILNFEYLLYCNLAAGRSFNDLGQYPIFPWVLKDYTSDTLDLSNPEVYRDLTRPVGALNPTRLAMFRERLREMKSDELHGLPFLYGTHYSCPGYTMFWLVRAAPGHILRLQNGRFDAPDRLFFSIKDAWDSVLASPTDVKELIPEFYMPEYPDFLLNEHHLALGMRQNGQPVGDVVLPPWAGGKAETFLSLQAAALESPFVSETLNNWIDLIFGVKSRGEAAENADNLFRHTSYENGVDIESISDPLERAALEVAINEFGQCPRQLFTKPHPKRLVTSSVSTAPAATTSAVGGRDFEIAAVVERRSGSSSSGGGTARVKDSTRAGQALSLALVSTIMAAIEEG